MVYIYVCKRFKVTMEMVSGRDGDWVNNLLQFYCKHSRIHGQLERAEINPKKRHYNFAYDSSTDVFKINLVYKDSKGAEHELKWMIKVTRSDVNETADLLLRHEKQVFSRLIPDFVNTVKQKSAGRLEGSRITFGDLLPTPEFIFEETAHATDQVRTVLVLDNLEEKDFCAQRPGPLNLNHLKMVVQAVARFHAVSLTYKRMQFASYVNQKSQVKASVKVDEIVMEGENTVPTGRHGLFARFPFLAHRKETLTHLLRHRTRFLDMYAKFLDCFQEESHLCDIFEYIRISTDDILAVNEDLTSQEYKDSPLDAITLGVLETRSFLFRYEDDENKENDKKKKNSKLQRSQSERIKDRTRGSNSTGFEAIKMARQAAAAAANGANNGHANGNGGTGGAMRPPQSPKIGNAKCPKLEGDGAAKKMQNKFLQNVIGKSKDDMKVPLTGRKASKVHKERDASHAPKAAALINAKYVTYGRITRDLAVVMWTSSNTLIRRYYLIKMVETYAETLGITLGQLGVDVDSFGIKYQRLLMDFQSHVLYGFLCSVLLAMAATNPEELDLFREAKRRGEEMEVDSAATSVASEMGAKPLGGARLPFGGPAAAAASSSGGGDATKYLPLTHERVTYLRDMMRDIGAYVESKDFEQGLPITNFERYHELWSMVEDGEEEDDGASEEQEEEEEEEGSEYEDAEEE